MAEIKVRKFKKVVVTEKPPEYGAFFKFENIGDAVEGVYFKKRENPARPGFKEQALYDLKGVHGELWTLNGNWYLDAAMKKVRLNSYVRATYVRDEDVGPGLTPARVIEVEVGE